jgi:hypothetical protein
MPVILWLIGVARRSFVCLRDQPSSANGNGKKLPKTGNIFPSSASCPPVGPRRSAGHWA